jgi:hypothetical protein
MMDCAQNWWEHSGGERERGEREEERELGGEKERERRKEGKRERVLFGYCAVWVQDDKERDKKRNE